MQPQTRARNSTQFSTSSPKDYNRISKSDLSKEDRGSFRTSLVNIIMQSGGGGELNMTRPDLAERSLENLLDRALTLQEKDMMVCRSESLSKYNVKKLILDPPFPTATILLLHNQRH